MGADIHVRVYKYNRSTNFYDEIKIYRKRKPGDRSFEKFDPETGETIPWKDDYRPVYIDVGRDSEMFDGMKSGDEKDGYGNFPMTTLTLESFNPEARAKLEELKRTQGYYDFFEISLAEMKLYIMEHPFVADYDAEWEDEDFKKPLKDAPHKNNPIASLFLDIYSYIYIAENCWMDDPLSFYKVVFYWDC